MNNYATTYITNVALVCLTAFAIFHTDNLWSLLILLFLFEKKEEGDDNDY